MSVWQCQLEQSASALASSPNDPWLALAASMCSAEASHATTATAARSTHATALSAALEEYEDDLAGASQAYANSRATAAQGYTNNLAGANQAFTDTTGTGGARVNGSNGFAAMNDGDGTPRSGHASDSPQATSESTQNKPRPRAGIFEHYLEPRRHSSEVEPHIVIAQEQLRYPVSNSEARRAQQQLIELKGIQSELQEREAAEQRLFAREVFLTISGTRERQMLDRATGYLPFVHEGIHYIDGTHENFVYVITGGASDKLGATKTVLYTGWAWDGQRYAFTASLIALELADGAVALRSLRVAQAVDGPIGKLVAHRTPSTPLLANRSASLQSRSGELTRSQIVDGLSGLTRQGDNIADALVRGDLELSILGDELFVKAWVLKGGEVDDVPQAFAYGEQLFVRRNASNILSDVVHEGTHGLDYLRGFIGTVHQREKRAFFFERQFQIAGGGHVDFSRLDGMLAFILSEYKN